MSAKLVVHKFESGVNFKTLQITIDDDDDGSNEARFSEWSDGKTQQKKNDADKSSRVIVKLVSGEGSNNFQLDYCAKEVVDPDLYLNLSPQQNTLNDYKQNLLCYEVNDSEMTPTNTPSSKLQYNNQNTHWYDDEGNERGAEYITMQQFMYEKDRGNLSNNNLDEWSPLEYSLERVNENNARIMENIHMLNRTLNYTKKKEILDIVCQKSRYPCNTCGKCFVYETGLKRHYSMRHSLSEMPRWQVVWTCIECFQVWPSHDLAMKHATQCCKNDNTDYVREIKTSSLLQCEFCEKVYTSIPRLLRHSKVHTTAKNYECNACESTFQSYKAAEQHWILCPWLKMCYSFSLPKMLLCNACDRKFKNYEHLYNHRYKVGHFMTKTHCNKSSIKSLGILVYQCEICGQWFTSIPLLQNHRSQHHSIYEFSGIHCKNEILDGFNTCHEATETTYHVNQIEDDMQNQKYA